jgi:ubiquinone/menaquinone biosynthesis C-methylase UbiE
MNKISTIEYNPFSKASTSQAYKSVDPVYQISARAAVGFAQSFYPVAPDLVLDIGAGTGVSAEIILTSDVRKLVLVEPSVVMLEEAYLRHGDKVDYVNSGIEDLKSYFKAEVDLAYALNCFHLFHNLQLALTNVSAILKPQGSFIFNLSSPTFGFSELSDREKLVIKANQIFYKKLYEITGTQILEYTNLLLQQILDEDFTNVYNHDKLNSLFDAFGMQLNDSVEAHIDTQIDYQQNIWRMISRSFIDDEIVVNNIIDSIALPDQVHIRQIIFRAQNRV